MTTKTDPLYTTLEVRKLEKLMREVQAQEKRLRIAWERQVEIERKLRALIPFTL